MNHSRLSMPLLTLLPGVQLSHLIPCSWKLWVSGDAGVSEEGEGRWELSSHLPCLWSFVAENLMCSESTSQIPCSGLSLLQLKARWAFDELSFFLAPRAQLLAYNTWALGEDLYKSWQADANLLVPGSPWGSTLWSQTTWDSKVSFKSGWCLLTQSMFNSSSFSRDGTTVGPFSSMKDSSLSRV